MAMAVVPSDGDPHGLCLSVLGKDSDDGIVGVGPGLQGKITVLQLCRGTLVPHIPAEQVGRADDARVLELLRDGGNAAALRDADGDLGAGLSIAVDLVVANTPAAPAASTSNSTTASKIFTAPPFFFGAVCLSLCAIRTFLCCFSASQPSSIRRI